MTIIALCVRTSAAAFAVVVDGNIIEVPHMRPTGASLHERRRAVARKARAIVTHYGAKRLVYDPGGLDLHETFLDPGLACLVERVPVREALRAIGGSWRNVDVLWPLASRYPKLRNLVTLLPGRNGIALSQRRRTVSLMAVALGLAVQERAGPRAPLFTS